MRLRAKGKQGLMGAGGIYGGDREQTRCAGLAAAGAEDAALSSKAGAGARMSCACPQRMPRGSQVSGRDSNYRVPSSS